MKKFLTIIALMVFLSAVSLVFNSPAFGERFDIRDNQTGGDCNDIGFWEKTSKTCNMTRDLPMGDQIRISSDDVTLNGMDHHIYGDGIISGVYIPDRVNVKVSNLFISNAENGIFLNNSSNNIIENITSVWNTQHGIYMIHNSNNNLVKNNSIGYSIEHGISIAESDNNKFENNFVTNTKDGIRLKISNYTTISENVLWENRVEGVDIHESSMNSVFRNYFFENDAIPILDDCDVCTDKFFSQEGGNYYLNYDEIAEGCLDSDSNGFCDDPISYNGAVDELPLIQNSKWDLNKIKALEFLPKAEALGPFYGNEKSETNLEKIPGWVKNLVMWLHFEEISEKNFTNAVEFLVQKEIINIPTLPNAKSPEDPIPLEIKFKLAWWGVGLADDEDFVDLISYLAEEGFIQV